jgi:cell division septum initiation protein DivIVA
MSQVNEERPQFAIAIRGYDRLQVDEYIDRLTEMVAEAEQRARQAESDLEHSRHLSVGPRVTEIFELAVEEAREVREQATEEAEKLRSASQSEADQILTRARDRADDVKAEIEAYRSRVEVELAELEAYKEEAIRELRRLQDALGAAAGLVNMAADAAEDAETVEEDSEEIAEEQARRAA